MAIVERTYTIPLRRGFWKSPRYRRTNKAIRTLREFLMKHMKADVKSVKIGQHLNEFLWERGMRNPPARVQVTVKKDDAGLVTAELVGKQYASVVKPEAAKQEPQGLREKLQAAIGGKEGEPKPEEQPAQEAPKQEKSAEKKPKVPKKANRKEKT